MTFVFYWLIVKLKALPAWLRLSIIGVLLLMKYKVTWPGRGRLGIKTETGALPQSLGESGSLQDGEGGKMLGILTRNRDQSINEMVE